MYTAAAGVTVLDWRGWRERCAVAGKLRCANLSANAIWLITLVCAVCLSASTILTRIATRR
ncbi:hypothetical protein ACLK1T_19520 [Escherichia coli]